MATEIRAYTLTIPAGTPATAPASVQANFPQRVVDGVEFIVPDGPNGVVGFALYQSNVRIIPFSSDLWIVTSGEKMAWPIEEYPTTGVFSLRGYNTGTSDHAVTIRFLLSRLGLAAHPAISMLDDTDLFSDTSDDQTADSETMNA